MTYKTEKIKFQGHGGTTLDGRLDLPFHPKAFAIFSHCFTCSKEFHATKRISQALAGLGIAVLRFDFAGLGGSSGHFSSTNFTTNVQDLEAAARFLEAEYEAPQLLIGHSLGGSAALVACSHLDSIKAVVTINAPCHPHHVVRHFEEKKEEVLWKGQADISIAGRTFKIQQHFFDELKKYNMDQILGELHAALLVLHSPLDETVHIRNAAYIFDQARHPKSFVSLDQIDHLVTRPEDATYIAHVIHAWASRYLETHQVLRSQEMEGHVIVQETGEGKYVQEIFVGRHTLKADEPISAPGGLDSGLSPYDFLLAGLGACTSMTLRMYADLKGLPLKKTTVRLHHSKKHVQDCEGCEEGLPQQIDLIERQMTLEGPLTPEHRESLLKIANKCPVHRTLTGKIEIETLLKEES